MLSLLFNTYKKKIGVVTWMAGRLKLKRHWSSEYIVSLPLIYRRGVILYMKCYKNK